MTTWADIPPDTHPHDNTITTSAEADRQCELALQSALQAPTVEDRYARISKAKRLAETAASLRKLGV